MAEELGKGLQNLVRECESRTRLQRFYNLGEWWNGIHEGLKIPCPKRLVGSNPTSPTNIFFMTKVSHDSETPAHGQQVLTAVAFIHHNFDGVEKIFMPQRAATKKFLPNIYELPGGHIDFGEDMVAGLKREILEEIGKQLRVGDPFAVFTYLNEIKGSHSIEVVYFAQFTDGTEGIQLQPEDHAGYRWVAEDELKDLPKSQQDDEEIAAIKKGFGLLRGEKLHS